LGAVVWVLCDNVARITISLCESIAKHSCDGLRSLRWRAKVWQGDSKESAGGVASCYDVARDLAGSVRGLPEDLAVNSEYAKDFGR
jgi:hypothetical protein